MYTGCFSRRPRASAAASESPAPPPRIAVVGVGRAGCVGARRIVSSAGLALPLTLIEARSPEDPSNQSGAQPAFVARRANQTHTALIQPDDRTPFCTIPPLWFRAAALRRRDVIRAQLRDRDVVLLVSALGGSVGSGAAPVVAKLARESDALVVAVVSTPFRFEGRRRARAAEAARAAIDEAAHLTLAIDPDGLPRMARPELTALAAYGLLDDEFDRACETVLDLLGADPETSGGVPVPRLRALLEGDGHATFTTGRAGDGRDAAQDVLSQLHRLHPLTTSTPRLVIAQVRGGNALPAREVNAARAAIRSRLPGTTPLLMDGWQDSGRSNVEVRLIVHEAALR